MHKVEYCDRRQLVPILIGVMLQAPSEVSTCRCHREGGRISPRIRSGVFLLGVKRAAGVGLTECMGAHRRSNAN